MQNVVRLVLAVALTVVAAGCETTLPPRGFPELSYTHLPPIRFDAVRVDVVQQYRSTNQPPNVEHEFPVRPAEVAARWANDRLQANGVRNIVRATIVDGAVVELPLQRSSGVSGVFTTDQSERYDGALEVRIEVLGPDGRQLAMVSSRATRSRSVPENITLAERERVWFRLTESMMNDLNLALEQQIREHFARWLR
jgi:hypothetical protein